jgi:hypothetical protein
MRNERRQKERQQEALRQEERRQDERQQESTVEEPSYFWPRRRFLRRSFAWFAGFGFFATLAPTPFGCSGGDLDTRVTGALLGLGVPPLALAPELDAQEWPRSRALEVLFGSLPAGTIEEALASPEALRRHIAERSRQDFDAGKTRLLHGWRLSESELAVAILTAPGRG